jgi:RimJ/RimL family protein N-acetyltransferase
MAAPVLRGERVMLRPWRADDLAPFARMNADARVMRHFPAPLDRAASDALAGRAQARLDAHGWGLWALQTPALDFAGFVGLNPVNFVIPVPGIEAEPREIGWRLSPEAWGQGYASEGARLAMAHAFDALGWTQLLSFTALGNLRSQALMRRIGLEEFGHFDHPRIDPGHPLRRHVLFAGRAG